MTFAGSFVVAGEGTDEARFVKAKASNLLARDFDIVKAGAILKRGEFHEWVAAQDAAKRERVDEIAAWVTTALADESPSKLRASLRDLATAMGPEVATRFFGDDSARVYLLPPTD